MRPAPGGAVVAGRQRHHEVGVEPAQPYVDRAGGEIAGDLVGRGGEHVEHHQPGRRLQGSGEPVGQLAGFVATGFGGHREFTAEGVDVRGEVHDAIVAPPWRQCKPWWRQLGVGYGGEVL